MMVDGPCALPFSPLLRGGFDGIAGDVEFGAFQGGSIRPQEVQRIFQGFLFLAAYAAKEFLPASESGCFRFGEFLRDDAPV